jgi:predicted alpha/beta superfamily hydrolase
MPRLPLLLIASTACIALAACSPTTIPASTPAILPEASPAVVPAVQPYRLEHTEVREITSKSLGRTYEVLVSLPDSYEANASHRFPVLFVTDANYAFPLVRSLAARVGSHGAGLEDFVLVGLSYAKGDTPEFSRRRDYTPTPRADFDGSSDMPGRKPEFGQSAAYRDFIANEVFPLVAGHYRVDMDRRIFAGHSYGALLGAYILVTQPEMFQRYILSSPSLWFDDKALLAKEIEYAKGHQDMVAEVFLTVGEFETIAPTPGDERYNTEDDLVGDMQLLQRRLEARNYPGLRIQSQVLVGEDHLSGNPVAFTRGLKWALPPANSAPATATR